MEHIERCLIWFGIRILSIVLLITIQSFLDLIREFRIQQARKELNHLLRTGKEGTILFVRPFVLFRECNCKASGTLIIAMWQPAPFLAQDFSCWR